MPAFAQDHADLFGALALLSGVMFVGSLIAVPWMLARLPADYFIREHGLRVQGSSRWYAWLAAKILKNALGAVLFLVGLVMLGLPGQGVLTMLAGLMLLEYPGKRALELRIIRQPRVLRAVNWIRSIRGRPPLLVERPLALPAPVDASFNPTSPPGSSPAAQK